MNYVGFVWSLNIEKSFSYDSVKIYSIMYHMESLWILFALRRTYFWLFTNPVAPLMIIANTSPPHKSTHSQQIHSSAWNFGKRWKSEIQNVHTTIAHFWCSAALSAFALVFTAFAVSTKEFIRLCGCIETLFARAGSQEQNSRDIRRTSHECIFWVSDIFHYKSCKESISINTHTQICECAYPKIVPVFQSPGALLFFLIHF